GERLNDHREKVRALEAELGKGCLIVPERPALEVATYDFVALGRRLMERIISEPAAPHDLFTGLTITDKHRFDIIVVAFPLDDAFGGQGAAALAERFREELQDPDAKRVVAILGLGVYGTDAYGFGYKLLGDYMGLQRDDNPFDGLIARKS